MVYIGIDPGARGGIGILNGDNVQVVSYSNQALIEFCQLYQNIALVTVEKVHAMPGQGVTSMFTFGRNYGYIVGVLEAFQMQYTLIDPRTWKNYFGITADKRSSIYKCQELYPGVNLLPTPRCKKESDGMAEALLIARWGLEHEDKNS
jgi:crossover junction endodeoxyribonuclease RuvC